MHWLVVRESSMRMLDRGAVSEKGAMGQRFYEGGVEPSIITLLRSKLRPGATRTTTSKRAFGGR